VTSLQVVARAWVVALDQLLYVSLAAPFAAAGLSEAPRPQETISSFVGRSALLRHRWAHLAERLIDGLFWALGEPLGHCRASIILFCEP
jgi:hypothetical protein